MAQHVLFGSMLLHMLCDLTQVLINLDSVFSLGEEIARVFESERSHGSPKVFMFLLYKPLDIRVHKESIQLT